MFILLSKTFKQFKVFQNLPEDSNRKCTQTSQLGYRDGARKVVDIGKENVVLNSLRMLVAVRTIRNLFQHG